MKLTLFANNLFDEKYVTSIETGGTAASVGDERKFGIQFSAKF